MKFKKILIIDDAPFIREILKKYFDKLEYVESVFEAEDGEEGVAAFREHKPDLIFMDIVMPKLSGIEATKQIRVESTEVPIVGLSTLDQGDVIDRIIEAGANSFVKKPFSIEDLDRVMTGEF